MRTNHFAFAITLILITGVFADGFADFIADRTVAQCSSDIVSACQ